MSFLCDLTKSKECIVHNMGDVTKADLRFGIKYVGTFTVWPTALPGLHVP